MRLRRFGTTVPSSVRLDFYREHSFVPARLWFFKIGTLFYQIIAIFNILFLTSRYNIYPCFSKPSPMRVKTLIFPRSNITTIFPNDGIYSIQRAILSLQYSPCSLEHLKGDDMGVLYAILREKNPHFRVESK